MAGVRTALHLLYVIALLALAGCRSGAPDSAVVDSPALPTGSPDPSFGIDGRVVMTAEALSPSALALQRDGKLVAVGTTYTLAADGWPLVDFALSRYHGDGSLDRTFGTDGRITADFGGADLPRSLAIQTDGKLVVAGIAYTGGLPGPTLSPAGRTLGRFVLARYSQDGSPDASFGRNGSVLTDFVGGGQAESLLIQPDGKLVAAGASGTATGFMKGFALARYNSDGSLDSSFGVDGRVTTPLGPDPPAYAPDASVHAMARQPYGKLVVAGKANNRVLLIRYSADGGLDRTFGSNGQAVTSFEGTWPPALLQQPDGKLVVAAWNVSERTLIARFDADGRLDPTFGQDGYVNVKYLTLARSQICSGRVFGCVQLPPFKLAYLNDRILLVGSLALMRFDRDGNRDPEFGSNGLVDIDLFNIGGLSLQPDGRAVVAGSQRLDEKSAQRVLARFAMR